MCDICKVDKTRQLGVAIHFDLTVATVIYGAPKISLLNDLIMSTCRCCLLASEERYYHFIYCYVFAESSTCENNIESTTKIC